MRRTVAKWSERVARGAVALGFALIGQTHAATITAAGVALTQGSGSSTCSYSQANESLSGDWSFTCGAGPATITISPNVNGTVCVTYGNMSEDVSGNWTIAGCVSATPTLTLDAPVQSSSTYPSNVPFTLKATATPPTGRTISSVEFFHDGVSIHTGALSGSQYVWGWSPPSGTYQVTVRATDNTGAVIETSPAVQMTFAPAVGPATIYYIHSDHLGTPREITRASDNQIVWRWDNTESFGNSQPNENPSGLGTFSYNLRFPGQYFDQETGTSYNYFRDYDPGIGRYLESDLIGLIGGLNTYGYVDDSPLSDSDPTGLAKLGATRKRPCNDEETRKCKETCGWKGVETCFVIQVFRLRGTRANKGGTGALSELEWRDGPPTCSCNDCEKTLKRFWEFLTGPNPYATSNPFGNRNSGGGPFPFPVAPLPIP